MKVLQVSASDIVGGAAKACMRLNQGLREEGTDSSLLVQIKRGNSQHVQECQYPNTLINQLLFKYRENKIQSKIKPYQKTRPWGLEIFSNASTPYRLIPSDLDKNPDIIHLHWVSRFIDFSTFFHNNTKPIVWTLHDLNPITGGCHYSDNCNRFQDTCGNCHQLGSNKASDLSNRIWNLKRKTLTKNNPNLHFVAPSNWMKEQIKASSLGKNYPVHVIPNGICKETWKPRNKIEAKESLNIPTDFFTILFSAESTTSMRKGFMLLLSALKKIPKKTKIHLLALGSYQSKLNTHIPCTYLGKLNKEKDLANAYNASDIFVIPSLEDNLPNTVLEAMACQLPVIGFNIGGIPDMIEHQKEGLLVKKEDISALKDAILYAYKNPSLCRQWADNAHHKFIHNFTLPHQAKRMNQLYSSILKK